jgi:hypothetical protein
MMKNGFVVWVWRLDHQRRLWVWPLLLQGPAGLVACGWRVGRLPRQRERHPGVALWWGRAVGKLCVDSAALLAEFVEM